MKIALAIMNDGLAYGYVLIFIVMFITMNINVHCIMFIVNLWPCSCLFAGAVCAFDNAHRI